MDYRSGSSRLWLLGFLGPRYIPSIPKMGNAVHILIVIVVILVMLNLLGMIYGGSLTPVNAAEQSAPDRCCGVNAGHTISWPTTACAQVDARVDEPDSTLGCRRGQRSGGPPPRIPSARHPTPLLRQRGALPSGCSILIRRDGGEVLSARSKRVVLPPKSPGEARGFQRVSNSRQRPVAIPRFSSIGFEIRENPTTAIQTIQPSQVSPGVRRLRPL